MQEIYDSKYFRENKDFFKQDYDYAHTHEEYFMTPNQQEFVQPKMFSIAEIREIVAKAWEDGYTTSSGDSFHNKNTPYSKSDFFKEFSAKYITTKE